MGLPLNYALFYSVLDPNDYVCHSYSYGLRAIIQCLPAWLRFIQCLRRYRDTKRAFPHLVNAGKYSTTFFVVTFAALYATHRGRTYKYVSNLFHVSCNTGRRFELSCVNVWKCIFCQSSCCKMKLRIRRDETEVSLQTTTTIFVCCCFRSMSTRRLLRLCIKPCVLRKQRWPWVQMLEVGLPCQCLQLYNGNGNDFVKPSHG